MRSSLIKSIGAVVVGFVTGGLLSVGTDFILETTGLMIRDPFQNNPVWLIAIVVVYRTIFNGAGCYVAAKLAPSRPLRYAMILGYIGVVLGIVGAIVMWDIPPHWYPVALVILTLPAAWAGGKLAES